MSSSQSVKPVKAPPPREVKQHLALAMIDGTEDLLLDTVIAAARLVQRCGWFGFKPVFQTRLQRQPCRVRFMRHPAKANVGEQPASGVRLLADANVAVCANKPYRFQIELVALKGNGHWCALVDAIRRRRDA